MKAAIDETLASMAAIEDRTQRTLTVLAAQLGSHRKLLREALRPYTLEGNFGTIFDAVEGQPRAVLLDDDRDGAT